MVAMRNVGIAMTNSLVVVLGSQKNMAMHDIQLTNEDISQAAGKRILREYLRIRLSNLLEWYSAMITSNQYYPGIHPFILQSVF